MTNKTKESKKTNVFFLLILFIIVIFYVNSDKDEVGLENNESIAISTNSEEKWVDSYQQIVSEDMIKVGDIIYTYEKDEYVPMMEVLDIANNIELENGYISKKAIQVKVYGKYEDIFWKDIEQTLKFSLSESGLKYFTKGKKYNP